MGRLGPKYCKLSGQIGGLLCLEMFKLALKGLGAVHLLIDMVAAYSHRAVS